MRKVTFGLANSLANYIARADDRVDWLTWTKEVAEITAKYWKNVDTIVMGRKTYDVARRMSKGGSNLYLEKKCYVLSRTLPSGQRDEVEIVSSDAARFVRRLKRGPGKEICVLGGGELAKSLFEARLVDEIGLNIHPVLLGAGIPLFHQMKRQIDLELRECRRFTNGCVFVRYRVKN